MNLEERRRGLLKLVEDYRVQECRRILTAAQQEAAELRRQSFHKQKAYLHSQVLAERSRARERIHAARAEQATWLRRIREHRNLELLRSAWPLVQERLLARWRVPEPRRRWVETYLRQARDLLPPGPWTVRHAPEWSEQEQRDALERLGDALEQPFQWRREADIEAGLIIESGGAVLDASLRGLLQDRARLEARLLALVAEASGA